MFTGIITHTTKIVKRRTQNGGVVLTFATPTDWNDLVLGESIATNGVCLTISAINKDSYDCYLMEETLEKSSFGTAVPDQVNLERALSAGDRFGGHFVQGHVDGVGTVSKIDTTDGYRIFIEYPTEFKNLVIYKGSITSNGVSLTVASDEDHTLSVALIPHSLEHTTLDSLKVGDAVNLEFDMIGKYVNKITQAHK